MRTKTVTIIYVNNERVDYSEKDGGLYGCDISNFDASIKVGQVWEIVLDFFDIISTKLIKDIDS